MPCPNISEKERPNADEDVDEDFHGGGDADHPALVVDDPTGGSVATAAPSVFTARPIPCGSHHRLMGEEAAAMNAARPELFIKTAIVILGGTLGIKAAEQLDSHLR
jgi:hypothetical protein